MTTLSSAAKDIDVKSGSGQLQDQDWTFGISEFDPSNPFLDDSALLGGLTPDWCGDFLDHSQFSLPIDRRDHSLTSHEASSDEEHGIGFSSKPQADISNNTFNSHDWSRTASYVAQESARPRYEVMEQQPANNNNDSKTVWHHVRHRPTPAGTSSTGHYNLDQDDEEDDACSVASDSSLVKFTSRSSSSTRSRSRQAETSAQNTRSSNSSNSIGNSHNAVSSNGIDIENSAHLSGGGGGGRESATGRKKATEQARTVLMDWLHENKGKERRRRW